MRSLVVAVFTLVLGTVASAQEKKKLPDAETVMKHLDANMDGKISRQEVDDAGDKAKFIAMHFDAIDKDSDGSLSIDEIKEALKELEKRQK